MASSDPPFDTADEPTTQPLRRPEATPSSDARETSAAGADDAAAAAQPSRDGAAADGYAGGEPARLLRQNTSWFEPGFGAEDDPPSVVTQPVEPAAQEAIKPAPQDSVGPEAQIPSPVVLDPAASEPARESAHVDGQPAEPRVEPRAMDTVAAEIAAALRASEPTPAPTIPAPLVFDDARAYVAPAPVRMPAPAYAAAPYAPSEPAPTQTERTRPPDLIVRVGKIAAIVFCAWFCLVLALIVLYRFVNPPFSALMAMQWLGGTEIRQDWVPLESISPNLIHAVVVSEDGRFCEHWGIDFVEIAEALKRTPTGPPRGASTITMQVAKNLFLWPAKSYVRKVIEVPLTYTIELFWPKRRILEVYLNIAEWGPGIFGAEVASQAHFNRPASRLSARQAAQLAVALPNPIVRDAGAPGPTTAHRASVIQRRTGREPEAIGCVLGGE
jgi:monofunctional biosynthetic peptidoglycan transglycosylase